MGPVIEPATIEFYVPGRPQVKARARRDPRSGRWFTPAPTALWEETVAVACRARRARFRGRVKVTIELRTFGLLRGDVDNYAKAILDGMQRGELLVDDRQVDELVVRQSRVPTLREESARVTVTTVPEGRYVR